MKDVNYIVFNSKTFQIVHTSKWYNKETHKIITSDKTKLSWINVTHPKSQDTLATVNQTNNTQY